MPDFSLSDRLATLPRLDKAALFELWRQLFKRDPPDKIRSSLMLRILAYRLQEQELGGLSDATTRRLRQLAVTFGANPKAVVSDRPPVKPGTRLVRQWKEQIHVVEVEAEGYAYRGSRYDNLSEIARQITGTRWSGPLFFGLKSKKPRQSPEAR
ncbi:MAG TPA: DUF2924 domain-containing protein [Terriglobia bacterium]|nr:DUF2924 domain-containing protein [Terriglobia bacterium]